MARRLAPAASSPSPSLDLQYLQAAQTSGANCWLISTKGIHWRPAASKYSLALLLGLLPQTAMLIWRDLVRSQSRLAAERHAAPTDAVRLLASCRSRCFDRPTARDGVTAWIMC